MHLKRRFQVSQPREKVIELIEEDETLTGLFPDAETEVVEPADRPEQPASCPYLSACHAVDPTSPLWQTCTEAVPHLVQLGGGRSVACHRFTETGTR